MDSNNDYCLLARLMIPTDAHVIRGCLEAAGIPVILTDDQHMQANLLLAPAIGGARILVRESDVARANDILAAYERGDLALPEDADVGVAEDDVQ
ncbi:putative signal transducing protein [Janthinobacterium sp. Mn2066]|uniref:putative signal transducing protein n=1 Tax=Janthinobacterium sp. Mn2066 TaxID=3395264 RepID=UPI003BC5CF9B